MIIYGKNPVKDLFDKDPSQIKRVWIDSKRHQSFVKELEKANIRIDDIKSLQYSSVELTGKENIQGIIANIKEPKIYSLTEIIESTKEKQSPKLLILDQIEDPQNFGAIIRNAAAFDVDGIIYPGRGAAGLNSTVMKTSAGNWMNVKLCETGSLNSVIKILKDNFYWIATTSLDANSSIDELRELNQPLAIILGNEGKGVRNSLKEKSDFKVKIDMSPNVESLNVASASAIVLHSLYKN